MKKKGKLTYELFYGEKKPEGKKPKVKKSKKKKDDKDDLKPFFKGVKPKGKIKKFSGLF